MRSNTSLRATDASGGQRRELPRRRGEMLGFLGPNGAGKTTTMRILTGYMPASDGKAMVAGFDVFDQSLEASAALAICPKRRRSIPT